MNEKCRSSIFNFISRFRIRHKAKWEKRRVSAFNKQNSCVRCCCIFSSSNFCINCSLPELLRNYCTWQHWNKCSVLCSADGFGRFHTQRDLYARANENEVHWNAKAVLAWRALTWSFMCLLTNPLSHLLPSNLVLIRLRFTFFPL